MPVREMGDGSEQGSIPEGAQRGRVRSSIRERGAVPHGAGQVAVARRLRLPALWRPTAQSDQGPRALSVHHVSAADVADRRHDLRRNQAFAAELVSRPLSPDSEQAGHLQPGARPSSRRHPKHGVDGQAQTQAGDDGARRQSASSAASKWTTPTSAANAPGASGGAARPARRRSSPPSRPPPRAGRCASNCAGCGASDARRSKPSPSAAWMSPAPSSAMVYRASEASPLPAAPTSRSAPARAAKPSSRLPSSGSTPLPATSRRRSSAPIGRSDKHVPRYLAEFEYRFNRRYDLAAMLPRLGWAAVRTPPMPYRLLKLAEFHA